MITIKELLCLPFSKDLVVVSDAASTEYPIKKIQVFAAESDIEKLSEGSLIIFDYPPEYDRIAPWLPELAAKKATVLIRPGDSGEDYMHFVNNAKLLGLPVLLFSEEAPYHEILEGLYRQIYLGRGIDIAKGMIEQYCSGRDKGINGIIDILSKAAKLPVFVFDCNRDMLACSIEHVNSEDMSNQVRKFEYIKSKYANDNIHEYSLGDYGYLVIVGKSSRMSLDAEEAVKCSLLVLTSLIHNNKREFEDKQNKLLIDILKKRITDSEKIIEKICEFKLNKSLNYLCISIGLDTREGSVQGEAVESFDGHNTHSEIYSAIKKNVPENVRVLIDDKSVLVLWPASDVSGITRKEADGIARSIMGYYKSLIVEHTMTMGVSASCSGITQLSIAYNEAMQALQLGYKIFGPGAIIHFDDLSMYRILLEMDDVRRIDKSLASINRIVEYDLNNNTELLKTLEAYYESNFNIKDTAYKLYVHYNSIQYRLKKISEITKLDIASSEGMFTLMVGLKLKKVL